LKQKKSKNWEKLKIKTHFPQRFERFVLKLLISLL